LSGSARKVAEVLAEDDEARRGRVGQILDPSREVRIGSFEGILGIDYRASVP
jgi:hypothetical protein